MIQDYELRSALASLISSGTPFVTLAALSTVVYSSYRLWARRVHGPRVLKITNLLLASPALVAGNDVALVERVVAELTKQCGSATKA